MDIEIKSLGGAHPLQSPRDFSKISTWQERAGSEKVSFRAGSEKVPFPSPCCYKLSPRPHVSVATTYGNMGVVYQKQGDYEIGAFSLPECS